MPWFEPAAWTAIFDRATCIKFCLSTVSERFSRNHGSYIEFVRSSETKI